VATDFANADSVGNRLGPARLAPRAAKQQLQHCRHEKKSCEQEAQNPYLQAEKAIGIELVSVLVNE
jgi:hypothetical protein